MNFLTSYAIKLIIQIIMQKKIFISLLFLQTLYLFSNELSREYAVFLGIDRTEKEKLFAYDLVVVEGEEFWMSDIDELHRMKKAVFAYLNIGALESYRTYYKKYRKFSLGTYKDWPDEKWIDTSKKEWQDFIKQKAFEYKQKGFDGFFVDNTDVYFQYKKEKIYLGLLDILKQLKKYEMKIIINGGDYFVSRLIKEKYFSCFDAVNQECVFTSINFKNNTYTAQNAETSSYFLEYLNNVKNSGKDVYLLEYGAGWELTKKITSYCREKKFKFFIAQDKNLKNAMQKL